MTRYERIIYAREYREDGFGRINDKRYREKHIDIIRQKDRLRKMMKSAKGKTLCE